MVTKFFDLPLRFQIMIPFSVLIIALAVVAVGYGLPLANKSASENLDLKLDNARSIFLLLYDHEADEIAGAAAFLAENPNFGAVQASADTGNVSEVLGAGLPDTVDGLQVTNVNGESIAAAGDHAPLPPEDIVRLGQAPAGGAGATIIPAAQGHRLVAVAPIGPPGDRDGFVVASRRLDKMLPELRGAVHAEMALYLDGQVVASTFGGEHAELRDLAELPAAAYAEPGPIKKGSVIDGQGYASAYQMLVTADGSDAGFGIFVPRSEAWPTAPFVAGGIAAPLLVSIALLMVGYAIATAIAARLERVVPAIEKIGDGDFHQRVDLDSSDEVGRLARTVNSMASRLEESEASKAEFLAMASHEMRTPLALMHNATELLVDQASGKDDEQERELLQIVAGNIDRMGKRVTDLLDLARMEAGHISLRKRPMDLGGLVEEVAESVQPMMEAKQQELSVEVPEDLPPVTADPDRIQQVLLNLLTNASRHTPPATHVSVGVIRDRQTETVEVRDTGPGLPKGRLTRLGNSGRRPFAEDSVGLGLTIAQRLVTLHGDRLVVESEPGKGTVFAFTLPCSVNGEGVEEDEDPAG